MGAEKTDIFVVRVKMGICQIMREKLEKAGLFDKKRKVTVNEGIAEIPVKHQPDSDVSQNLLNIGEFDVGSSLSTASEKPKTMSLKDKLTENIRDFGKIELSPGLLDNIPDSWELYGNLLLLPIDSFTHPIWSPHMTEILQIIAKTFKVAKIARKHSVRDDDFRSPHTELLLGDTTWVSRRENGITYQFDLTKCMFSIGNISEKIRVANLQCTGETVVDMFAGIGYFTLPYLVHAGAHRVIACEWNPDSVVALKKNIEFAGVSDRCRVIEGDNREITPVGLADRVNLGLIPSSELSWPAACLALKDTTGGVLHIHGNVETVQGEDKRLQWRRWGMETSNKILDTLIDVKGGQKWTTNILHIECVKSYAPRIYHIVLDLVCRPVCK